MTPSKLIVLIFGLSLVTLAATGCGKRESSSVESSEADGPGCYNASDKAYYHCPDTAPDADEPDPTPPTDNYVPPQPAFPLDSEVLAKAAPGQRVAKIFFQGGAGRNANGAHNCVVWRGLHLSSSPTISLVKVKRLEKKLHGDKVTEGITDGEYGGLQEFLVPDFMTVGGNDGLVALVTGPISISGKVATGSVVVEDTADGKIRTCDVSAGHEVEISSLTNLDSPKKIKLKSTWESDSGKLKLKIKVSAVKKPRKSKK